MSALRRRDDRPGNPRPGSVKAVVHRLGRRDFLRLGGAVAVGGAAIARETCEVARAATQETHSSKGGGPHQRRRAILLVAAIREPAKDLVAATLGWICRERDVIFDVHYLAPDRQTGRLFSPMGSPVVGGRHYGMLARFLSRFETTVLRLGETTLYTSLFREAGVEVLDGRSDDLAGLYRRVLEALGVPWPDAAVAVQTEGLPEGLRSGVTPYVFPEVTSRQALAVRLEEPRDQRRALHAAGIKTVFLVSAPDAATIENWRRVGFRVEVAEPIREQDNYGTFTFREAEKHLQNATGVDFCEPRLASCLLPLAVAEQRLFVCHEQLVVGAERLGELNRRVGSDYAYFRYGGGIGHARNDEDMFPCFRKGVALSGIEPRRPPLPVLVRHPEPLPQPPAPPAGLHPPDSQLERWARERRILVTLIMHSGEFSHYDAVLHIMDLCGVSGVKMGLGVGWKRYAWGGPWVEMLNVPPEEGGLLGICEPVLHSTGQGIVAEHLAEPARLAAMMASARDRIAQIAGKAFAPTGVYCFLDVPGPEFNATNQPLWEAIREAGFEYVVTSAHFGQPRIVYRHGAFVVLNQCGRSHYPYSPFVRVSKPEELAAVERRLAEADRPGWLIGVLDSPIFGYTAYLSHGDPFGKVRLAEFFDYIRTGGVTGRVVSATPRTISRYARLLATG